MDRLKKHNRKRYFSIIFVPDHEQNPRSISISYAVGRMLIALMVVLSVHLVLSGYGYFRIFQLEKISNLLEDENQDLKDRNRRIEEIVRLFNEIRATDEKIRKAFGSELGIREYNLQDFEALKSQTPVRMPASTEPLQAVSSMRMPLPQVQNSQYFLTERSGDYFDPEYLPTQLPVEGYLTTRFQKGGKFPARSHNGIDLAAQKGTVIRAAGAGIVILADWTPDFGNVIVISHGNGFVTYYAHAMRLLVDQGTQVRKAQQIALLGSSGRSSAPHLHFEIWKNGEPLDPEKLIFALQRREGNTGS